MVVIVILLVLLIPLLSFLNWLSYRFLKERFVRTQGWDLNICCGKTDYGRVNADIIQHAELPGFIKIDNVFALPFADKEFNSVLCSHTVEHVEDPEAFDRELRRVGNMVCYLVPPIWDLSAACNFIEHKWLFLTWKTWHYQLPRFIRLPFSRSYQKIFGQIRKA